MWDGTTPLLVVAGLALYVAALEAAEPLAQEVDHPGLSGSYPIESGRLHVQHLAGVIAATAVIVVLAGAAAVAVDPSAVALRVAAAAIVPATIGAAGSAVVSVLMGAPSQGPSSTFVPPEVAGMKLVARTAWPPLLSILGLVPVLVARAAIGDGVPLVAVVAGATVPLVLVAVVVAGWVRFREQAKAWWLARLEEAFPARG